MSRKKLSEFRAKSLLFDKLGQTYTGLEINSQNENWQDSLGGLDDSKRYVVKVDQAEKGRFKKGLVKLDRQVAQLNEDINELFALDYSYALVEEYKQHDSSKERYLTIERVREGKRLSYSTFGGVDIESHSQEVASQLYDGQPIQGLDMPNETLAQLVEVFDDNYFSFLEINPYILEDGGVQLLDAAVEVDDEASFFEDGWQPSDIRRPKRQVSEEELVVQELSDNSQASFSLELINQDGSIWLLLSGGGASVVVADEVHNLGFGKDLGNYGEYSGNPNTEETRLYTEQVIKLMLASKASKKVLAIAGGVANFTDVRQTFKGVIEALDMHLAVIKEQACEVYVRRGGPHEKEGLQLMKDYLASNGIAGSVAGPEILLSDVVGQAVKAIKA